jgi:hypothetical protein
MLAALFAWPLSARALLAAAVCECGGGDFGVNPVSMESMTWDEHLVRPRRPMSLETVMAMRKGGHEHGSE